MKRVSLKLGSVPLYPAILEAVKRGWSNKGRGGFNHRELALVDKAVGNAGRKMLYPVPFDKWARVASGHAPVVLESLGLL